MEQLFDKYKNIQLFATSPKYRNYKLVLNGNEGFADFETFKNKIQLFGYIMHSFRDPKNPDIPIDLYLFQHESQYIKDTNYFKKILDKYTSKQIMILITKEELNIYRKKSIIGNTNIICKNYLHKHFIMEINRGPLCSKHIILSPEEVQTLCYNTMAHGHRFPSILEYDPQNIWIGGQVNDIIMIESYSEITGHSIHYRIVTPVSGKISQNKARIEPQWTSQKNEVITSSLEAIDETPDDNNRSEEKILNEQPVENELEYYESDYEDIESEEEEA
jgi:DNA-directed RNA polymerase subunit H (RpoH/RPB5)